MFGQRRGKKQFTYLLTYTLPGVKRVPSTSNLSPSPEYVSNKVNTTLELVRERCGEVTGRTSRSPLGVLNRGSQGELLFSYNVYWDETRDRTGTSCVVHESVVCPPCLEFHPSIRCR